MTVIDGRTWMELLSPDTCWQLLETQEVGRIAYLLGGEPEVVPINYGLDDHSVVFRTDPGAKLAAFRRNDRVAFEVDHTDPDSDAGWSVMVKGTVSVVTDPDARRRLARLPMRPWALGRKDVWMRISAESVSGRAIHHRSEDDTVDSDLHRSAS